MVVKSSNIAGAIKQWQKATERGIIMSLTGSSGIGMGNKVGSFLESLEGPPPGHPNRQKPPEKPLFERLKEERIKVTLPKP
jgi:hypothetical protein